MASRLNGFRRGTKKFGRLRNAGIAMMSRSVSRSVQVSHCVPPCAIAIFRSNFFLQMQSRVQGVNLKGAFHDPVTLTDNGQPWRPLVSPMRWTARSDWG